MTHKVLSKLLYFVLLCALFPLAAAQAPRPSVSVSATGTAYGRPDRASFDAGVNVVGEDVQVALARANERASSLLTALQEAGVAPADVRTVNFSVSPEQIFDRDGQPERIRYRVVSAVRVTVRDAEQLGALLGASAQAGANELSNVVYTVADPSALERRARVQAMRAARAKAEQLARLSGARLGGPQQISETADGGGPIPFARFESAAADASVPVPVSGGQLEVTVTVQITYRLR